MSPVMARCACPEAFPIAECLEHAPPALFAPATPPDGRDPFGAVIEEAPPVGVAIAIGGITAVGYVLLGAGLVFLGRVVWPAARAAVAWWLT